MFNMWILAKYAVILRVVGIVLMMERSHTLNVFQQRAAQLIKFLIAITIMDATIT